MLSFKRGDTPTFVFSIRNVSVDDLGEPMANIVQDDFSASLDVVVDGEANAIRCKLDRDDSVMLIGGFPALLQHTWTDDDGSTFTFPPEEVFVEPAYIPFDPSIEDMYGDEDIENVEDDEASDDDEDSDDDESTETLEEGGLDDDN